MDERLRTGFFRWLPCVLAASLLAACNLFNPSGDGSYPSQDPDAFIDLGERALQSRDFATAKTNFDKALALDSSKSLAYQGLAKAQMGLEGFSLAMLVQLADTLHKIVADTDRIGFLANLSTDTLNRIYRPLTLAGETYRKFQTRTNLGKIDNAFGFHLVKFEFDAMVSSRTYFRLLDANSNGFVEAGELRTMRMLKSFATSGGAFLNADTLAQVCAVGTDGATDPAAVASINGILQNLSTITQDTLMRSETSGSIQSDTTSATSQVSQQALDFIGRLGTSTSFYRINDSLDNDGDGCVNEEIYGDSLDNDGDSLKEEDGRIGYQASKTPVPGQQALVSPSNLSLKTVFEASTNRLSIAPRLPDDLTWADANGLLSPYQGMRWVGWDDATGSGNDTVFARVVRTETGGAYTSGTVRSSPNYEKIRSLAIIEIRKKVLSETDATKRVQLGKSTVGGCWDAL